MEEVKEITKEGYLKKLNAGTYSEELTKIKKQLMIGLEKYIDLAGKSTKDKAKTNVGLALTLKDALAGLVDWKVFLNRLNNTSMQCERAVEEVEVSKNVEGTFSITTTIKTKDVPVKKVNDFPDLLASTVRDALAVYHGVLDTQKDTLVDVVVKAENKLAKQKGKKDKLEARIKVFEKKLMELEISSAKTDARLESKQEVVDVQKKHIDSNDETKKLLAAVFKGVEQTNQLLQLEGPGSAKLSSFKGKVVSAGKQNNNRDFGKLMVEKGYAPQAIVDMLKQLASWHSKESEDPNSKLTQKYAHAAVKLVTTYGTSMSDMLKDVEFDWALPKGSTGKETIDDKHKEQVLRYSTKLIEVQCKNTVLADVLQAKYAELFPSNTF